MSIKGRINFLQLSRYSDFGEQHFRNQFEKEFDFLNFNIELSLEHASEDSILAFDPSYVSKSGKRTPGVGYFWSGCAGRSKWGLEVGGIGVIDLSNHTSLHLEAIQTPSSFDSKSLLDHYAEVLISRSEKLFRISKYIAVDAYFSKEPFVGKMTQEGFHTISRLRDDANLRYLFKGEQSEGRGRPKQYDGKVDYKNLNQQHAMLIEKTDNSETYQMIVNSVALKREINLVIVRTKKRKYWSHKLYFSTDLNLPAMDVLRYYRGRFQIEFTYRDGKQHTAMDNCQARSENKIHFHINTSLTAVNIAKVSHWLNTNKSERTAFSMSDIKTLHHNQLLMDRFLIVFGINPNTKKNKEKVRQLNNFGLIAA
ncbi:transposase [Labilibaculum manganireducens]|nr:transposase [Labilibaculum manganireducens]